VPFAALSRAQGWSPWRTARITALCGFGHVTVSVLLGLLALVFGLEMLELFGRRMESVAGLLLIGFGLTYGLLGLRRAVGRRLSHAHGHEGPPRPVHSHAHSHVHVTDHAMTPWALFLLFSADPCVAVIPILFAAAPLGAPQTVAVVVAYEIATIGTMIALVLPASAAASLAKGSVLNRYGDATAGGVIAAVGVMVAALGW
jgi:ABC-type nickel/cobalt efflux system permease component RcnA